MAIEHHATKVPYQKVAKLEEASKLEEVVVRAVEGNMELVKAKTKEKKVMFIIEAKLKGIKEFKALRGLRMRLLRAPQWPIYMASRPASCT